MEKFNRNKNAEGDPDELWISREAIAITLEECYEGEGIQYVHIDQHKKVLEALEVARDGLEKVDKGLDGFDIKASDMRIGKPCLVVAEARSQVKQALAQIDKIIGVKE